MLEFELKEAQKKGIAGRIVRKRRRKMYWETQLKSDCDKP